MKALGGRDTLLISSQWFSNGMMIASKPKVSDGTKEARPRRCRNEISNRAELFHRDFEGMQAGGVIVDLAGGDDFVGVSLLE